MDAPLSNRPSQNGQAPISRGKPWWPRSGDDPSGLRKSDGELRKFALVVSVPLVLLGSVLAWRGRWIGFVLLALAGLLVVGAALRPSVLGPVERAWMKLAMVLSVVMTYVILTLTFFLVITPVGFLVRNIGRGGLALRFERERPSYWEPVEEDGPGTRSDRPY